MDWKRIGRAAMCFLVICCLLFNLSPIRAEAAVIEASILFGVVAVAILGAAGVIYVPQTQDDVVALGESMHSFLYQWGANAEKLDDVDNFFGVLRLLNFGNGGDDNSPDVNKNTKVTLARAILAGITAWVGTVILDGATKKEAEHSPGNYPSHFPALPEWDMEAYPYFFVARKTPPGSSSSYYLFYSDSPVTYLGDHNETWYFSPRPVSVYPEYRFSSLSCYSNGDWVFEKQDLLKANSEALDKSMYVIDYGVYFSQSYAPKIAYSNYDIYDLNGEIYFEGDDSNVSYVEVPYLPDILLGDTAPGIAEGTVDIEDIELPESLELGGLIHSSETALKDILNAQKELLEDPDKYDLYLEQLTQPLSPSNPNPGTGTNPGTGSGTLSEMDPNTFFQKIASVFSPSGDYMTSKVDALREEFVFADSIAQTAKALVDGLKNVTTEPPMIYIDLGANTGPYDLGGKVLFLDLRWYADYKPTVDGIISAFLYACFVWKTYLKLPGILNGASGKFELSHRREQEDL